MIRRAMRACYACRRAPGGSDRPCVVCHGRGEIRASANDNDLDEALDALAWTVENDIADVDAALAGTVHS